MGLSPITYRPNVPARKKTPPVKQQQEDKAEKALEGIKNMLSLKAKFSGMVIIPLRDCPQHVFVRCPSCIAEELV